MGEITSRSAYSQPYAACRFFLAVRGFAARAFEGRDLAPAWSRLRRRRSIRSTTPPLRGVSDGSSVTFLPFTLPLMIRIRLSRYASVYFSGSHSAARLL